MGKRIIQQARGRGGPRYRVRRKSFRYRIGYPLGEGKAKILSLINSPAHSAPIAKILMNGKIFYNLACKDMFEGQEIEAGGSSLEKGNILALKEIPNGLNIYNIELRAGDGGKLVRSSGSFAVILKKTPEKAAVLLPSKKEIWLGENCRATIGMIAGQQRLEKPICKAGKMFYIKKARSRLWPRTSAVKMNVVDHPFGSGRGKNLSHGGKGKIPKRFAPAGAKVGSLSPRRTGRRR